MLEMRCVHKSCRNGFLYFAFQFFNRTDTFFFFSIFRSPNRQRDSPEPRARQIPVYKILEQLPKRPVPVLSGFQLMFLFSSTRRSFLAVVRMNHESSG